MSEMNNLDLSQLEEASGGVYTGSLSPAEINLLNTLIKWFKKNGSTLEDLLNHMTDTKGDFEYTKTCKQYVRAYWDYVQYYPES